MKFKEKLQDARRAFGSGSVLARQIGEGNPRILSVGDALAVVGEMEPWEVLLLFEMFVRAMECPGRHCEVSTDELAVSVGLRADAQSRRMVFRAVGKLSSLHLAGREPSVWQERPRSRRHITRIFARLFVLGAKIWRDAFQAEEDCPDFIVFDVGWRGTWY